MSGGSIVRHECGGGSMRPDYTTSTVDGAAASAANDADTDDDRPALGDVVDTMPDRRPGKSCGVLWGRWHDTAAEADAHGCWRTAEKCRWGERDRCQHGQDIDAPDTHYDPDARRFTCAVVQSRRPR